MLKKVRLILQYQDNRGFSLIEALLGIIILAVASISLFALINFTLKVIWESRAKITATQLANQKIEMAQNLSYENVGTVGGIPAGLVPASEIIKLNGADYEVITEVQYVDDPFDGTLGGDPDDTLNTDYKKIRVEVSWPYRLTHQPIVFITNIVPPGLESSVGGGTLKILVYNAYGQPVAQANVNIVNTTVDPNININTLTDNQGYVIRPGSPEAIESYKINILKEGYSAEQTYDSTPELPSPEKPHASVFEGEMTNISFAIDLLSDLNIKLQNENGIGLSGVILNVRGDKTIGLDAEEGYVYKYNQNHTSNASGSIILSSIEWDTYNFMMPESAVYNISETVPLQPLNLLPATSTDVTITLAPKAEHSALVIVKDVNEQPLGDATVHFYTLNLSFDETIITDTSGQAYFTPWTDATSTLDITLPGFENYSDTFDLSGYHIEQVILVNEYY
ncbi:MAG: prepilin-type N-terminal cleavage/methylation domain-containing protein [Candidatus Kuenenbacteria bacterium]